MALTRYLDGFRTLVRGVVGVSKATLGTDPADEETIADRRRLCAMCDSATHRKTTGMQGLKLLTPMSSCRACHCNIKLKASIASEKCPLGKW